MRKLFKKALACCLVAALALTCFVGALSVNAETAAALTGKIEVGTVEVANDATTATVPVVITSDNALNAAKITVAASEGWEVSAIAIDAASTAAKIEAENINGDTFIVEAFDNVAGFTTATVNVTFTSEAAVAATITATLDPVHAATWNEDVVNLAVTGGAITVAASHTHTYDGVAYMNKEDGKWYIDCACGESSIETEANVLTANLISNALLFEDAVGSLVGINRAAKNGITTLGYADYYFEVEYQSYGTGYVLGTKTATYDSSDYDYQNGAKTVDYFKFTSIALYEMALDFTINLYLEDANGVVVAMTTYSSSVQKQALAYAAKYSTDTALLTALVDMVNYGAAVQEFFAAQNAGSDIDGAVLPTVGFEDYQTYASDEADLPESFNTTKAPTKVLSTTTLAVGTPTLQIGASNSVRYSIKANEYEAANLKLVATYVNSYGTTITDEVSFADLEVSVGTNTVYTYVFKKLALYDLEKTVKIQIYNNDVEEYAYDYSVGYYATTYLNNAQLGGLIKAMELFGQSARIKLVGA